MGRKDAIKKSLDKVTARIAKADYVPGFRLIEQALADSEHTPLSKARSKFSEVPGLILAVACLVLGAAFFTTRLLEYGDWPPAVYSSPDVFNLTKEKIIWDIHYGKSLGCADDECYRLESTPPSYFRRHEILPMREFPLSEWSTSAPIFYRGTFKLPQRLIERSENEPISLHTIIIFAKQWDLYLNNQLVFQGSRETMLAPIPRQFIRPDGTISIAIKVQAGDLPYQGISNRGDLVIGPRDMLAPLAYFAHDSATSLQLLYLLPKLSFCIVFAMLFMFVRRHQEIMWFLLFGLTSSLELYLRSGYASGLGLSGHTTELLALVARNYSLMLMGRFIYAFFRLDLPRADRLMKAVFTVITLLNVACFTLLDYKAATTCLDVLAIILKPAVYLFSLFVAISMAGLLSKSAKSVIRSRIALAFSGILLIGCILAFFDLARLIADTFNFSISTHIVGLTWIFDLILFVFIASVSGIEMAVQHANQRHLQNQLQNIDDRLELAQTVQATLLPSQMAGSRDKIAWDCKYISAERLAGDWIFLSDGRYHKTRFFLGDVTGKGPAAALAVAAIVSLLRKKDFEPSPLDSTIKELNIHLYNLFRGNVGSALCAAQMEDDGNTAIVVHGMAGWIHVSKSGAKIIAARGQSLGSQDQINVDIVTTKLDVGDFIFAFSDGCLEGARPISKLVRMLSNQAHRVDINPDELFILINEIGKDLVHADDKAMIYLRRTA